MRLAMALAAGVVALTAAGAAQENEPFTCDGLGQSTSACVLQVNGLETIDAQWQRDSHRVRLELPGAVANVSVSVDSVSPANGTLIVGLGSDGDTFAIGRTIINPGGAGTLVRCGVPARTTWVTILGLRSKPSDYRLTISPDASACPAIGDAATPQVATIEPQAGPAAPPDGSERTATTTGAGVEADPVATVAAPTPVRRPPALAAPSAAAPTAPPTTPAAAPTGEAPAPPADAEIASPQAPQPEPLRPEPPETAAAPATTVEQTSVDGSAPDDAVPDEAVAALPAAAEEASPSELGDRAVASIRIVNFSPRQRVIELRDAVCDRGLGAEAYYPWDLRAVEACLDDRGLASIEVREQDGDWRPFADLRGNDLVRF